MDNGGVKENLNSIELAERLSVDENLLTEISGKKRKHEEAAKVSVGQSDSSDAIPTAWENTKEHCSGLLGGLSLHAARSPAQRRSTQ